MTSKGNFDSRFRVDILINGQVVDIRNLVLYNRQLIADEVEQTFNYFAVSINEPYRFDVYSPGDTIDTIPGVSYNPPSPTPYMVATCYLPSTSAGVPDKRTSYSEKLFRFFSIDFPDKPAKIQLEELTAQDDLDEEDGFEGGQWEEDPLVQKGDIILMKVSLLDRQPKKDTANLMMTSKNPLQTEKIQLPTELVGKIGSFVSGKSGSIKDQLKSLQTGIPRTFAEWEAKPGPNFYYQFTVILENGGNPNQKDSNGKTALMKLIAHYGFYHNEKDYEKLIDLLINNGLSLSVKDNNGDSILHYAVKRYIHFSNPTSYSENINNSYKNQAKSSLALIKMLYDMGAPLLKNNEGKFPQDYLKDSKLKPALDILSSKPSVRLTTTPGKVSTTGAFVASTPSVSTEYPAPPPGSIGAGSGETQADYDLGGGRRKKTKKVTKKRRTTRRK